MLFSTFSSWFARLREMTRGWYKSRETPRRSEEGFNKAAATLLLCCVLFLFAGAFCIWTDSRREALHFELPRQPLSASDFVNVRQMPVPANVFYAIAAFSMMSVYWIALNYRLRLGCAFVGLLQEFGRGLHSSRRCRIFALLALSFLAAPLAMAHRYGVWSLHDYEIVRHMSRDFHPVWKELALGRIRAGQSADDVIRETPPVSVERVGDFRILCYHQPQLLSFHPTVMVIVAKGGKLIAASAFCGGTGGWRRTFFDHLTNADHEEFRTWIVADRVFREFHVPMALARPLQTQPVDADP